MIPLFKVHHTRGIGEKIEKLFSEGIITEGEYSASFEEELPSKLRTKNISLTNSCTSALSLAFHLCDIKEGDEVISSPMTCMATNEPIHTRGAKIVWADIDPNTGNIDPQDVERKITEKTKAITAVHWGGQPFDVDELMSFGKPVVEDAAHALGAMYKDKPVGTIGDYGCFSFQAIKHLTTADGGALYCRKPKDNQRAKKLKWFGLDRNYSGPKWEQDITESGYKYHMNNLNALIGLEQLTYIDDLIQRHKDNCKFYDETIDNKNVKLIKRPEWSETSCWIYSLLVSNKRDFEDFMRGKGISCDSVHVRNDTYSTFREFKTEGLTGVDEFTRKMTNIPVGWWLSNEDLSKIVEAVNSFSD